MGKIITFIDGYHNWACDSTWTFIACYTPISKLLNIYVFMFLLTYTYTHTQYLCKSNYYNNKIIVQIICATKKIFWIV